jgi:peroxiredoxin
MKNTVFFIPLIFLFACSGKNTIQIHGTFTKAENKTVYLDEMSINSSINLDSVNIKQGGAFRFKRKAEEPSFYQLKVAPNNFITLFIEPGEKVYVESDKNFLPNGYSVEGSEGSALIKLLDDHLLQTQQTLDSIVLDYRYNMDKEGFDTLEVQLNEKYNTVLKQQRRFTIGFILDHITSLVSIKALYQQYDSLTYVLYDMKDLQYVKIVADSLKVYYPESKHTRALVADLESEMARFNAQRINNLISSTEPTGIDISLPTVEGDTIALSSLRGNYVLLSFWASWDEASTRENAALKNVYNQYHSRGFEIYQVSFDNDKEAWRRAIHFDELAWINVSDLNYPNSTVLNQFNIQKLPANFLLDREGDIIGKDFTGRTLNIKLAQLFD